MFGGGAPTFRDLVLLENVILSRTFVLKQLVKEEITQTNRKADSSFATVFFSCRFVTTLVLRDFIFRKRGLEENSSSFLPLNRI